MSNFAFLQTEWPALHDAASKAEALAYPDARTACFHARRGLEVLVHWLYKYDTKLRLPYQDNLSALIHEPTFKHVAGDAVLIVWKISLAGGPSSFTRMATTIGCGMTRTTRRALCRVSTRRPNWNCSFNAASRASHWPKRRSTRPS